MPRRPTSAHVPPYLLAARLRRRAERAGTPVHWRRLEAAVDRLRAQGDDPLAERADEYRFMPDGPYVCPGCFGLQGDHALGCDEERREMERDDERDRCGQCGATDCDCRSEDDISNGH